MLFSKPKKVLTYNLSEPLNGAESAKVDIYTGTGNLTIDTLTGSSQELVSGELQYLENQNLPVKILDVTNSQATLTLKADGGKQPGFHFPWEACNGATGWSIHLCPKVSSDIAARSGGGNIKLDLVGLVITRALADTGGGNVDVVLPEKATDLNVTAKTGGGNVTVQIGSGTTGSNTIEAKSGAGNVTVVIPGGIAAKIYATSGLGQVLVDSQFSKVGDHTYQSTDFDGAANKLEITAQTGAGNVSVSGK